MTGLHEHRHGDADGEGGALQEACQHAATEGFESLLQGQHAEEENRHTGVDGPEIRTDPEPNSPGTRR